MRFIYLIGFLLISFNLQAEMDISEDLSDLSPEERAWIEDDSSLEALVVSTGDIRWLKPEKTQQQYRLENTLTIPKSALIDGWVHFEQCHYQLDAVSKIDVVFNKESTKNLAFVSSKSIEKVTIHQAHASLDKVSKGAYVCLSGESKTLMPTNDGFTLSRGPYMRKFLSGYYPMHLKEEIIWPTKTLTLTAPENTEQIGKHIIVKQGKLNSDYWFEGRLMNHYQFEETHQ